MRYFGSKHSTLDQVYEIIKSICPSGVFCDPFGGVGTIGSFFKKNGYRVIAGDLLYFAHLFQISRIEASKIPPFSRLKFHLDVSSTQNIIDILNNKPTISSWITKEYSMKRHFFTRKNAYRIDTCLQCILNWFEMDLLSRKEHALLVTSLINSADKVANTAGTYYAYLKQWHRKSLNDFVFELVKPTAGVSQCQAFHLDAIDLVKKFHVDILYLDPPYNERSHAHYYHLPESIAYGKLKLIHGKSGIPVDLMRSQFNTKKNAAIALEKLLDNASYQYVVFHYSDEGIIPPDTVLGILNNYGYVDEFKISAWGYRTVSGTRDTNHRVYLVSNDKKSSKLGITCSSRHRNV